MKKKILLVSLMVAVLMCLFAMSVFAENKIIKLDTLPTLEEIHANPSAYVSHLDNFDSSSYKEKDASSVVVLSDLAENPTYYVYPTYYILERTSYYPSMDNLNTAVTNSGIEGAFASFASTGQRGSNISIIRIEIPTYITQINGNEKFQGSTNLKEIYFPTKTVTDSETGLEKEVTCITIITGQDLFGSCSSLEVIHNTDKLPLGINAQANFSGCKNLKEFKFPAGLTSIAGSLFSNCSSLTEIEIPETVTSIGGFAFNNCSSITELVLPNGLTSVGKHAFGGCSKLEKIVMGASFTTFARTNADYETFSGCSSLKYIYLPATFADSVNATKNDFKTIFSHSAKTIYFVTENDYDKIVEIQNKFITTNANSNISNATIELYDPEKDYEAYQATLTKSVIVYNYSACEAFYNGAHDVGDEYTIEYSGDMLLSSAVKSKACSKCIYKVGATSLNPLFKSLGYSSNGNGSVVQGFWINSAQRAEYEEVIGKLDFGVAAVADTREDKAEGADVLALENGISHSLSNAKYDYFEIRLNDIEEKYYDSYVFLCAYVKVGEGCYYINNGVIDTVATSTTYRIEVINKQDNAN